MIDPNIKGAPITERITRGGIVTVYVLRPPATAAVTTKSLPRPSATAPPLVYRTTTVVDQSLRGPPITESVTRHGTVFVSVLLPPTTVTSRPATSTATMDYVTTTVIDYNLRGPPITERVTRDGTVFVSILVPPTAAASAGLATSTPALVYVTTTMIDYNLKGPPITETITQGGTVKIEVLVPPATSPPPMPSSVTATAQVAYVTTTVTGSGTAIATVTDDITSKGTVRVTVYLPPATAPAAWTTSSSVQTQAYRTITKTGTGSVTYTATEPVGTDSTVTVVVYVPYTVPATSSQSTADLVYVTLTKTGLGSVISTVTEPDVGSTVTVIVYEPFAAPATTTSASSTSSPSMTTSTLASGTTTNASNAIAPSASSAVSSSSVSTTSVTTSSTTEGPVYVTITETGSGPYASIVTDADTDNTITVIVFEPYTRTFDISTIASSTSTSIAGSPTSTMGTTSSTTTSYANTWSDAADATGSADFTETDATTIYLYHDHLHHNYDHHHVYHHNITSVTQYVHDKRGIHLWQSESFRFKHDFKSQLCINDDINATTLFRLNLTTGLTTTVTTSVGLTSSDSVNAIGYNVLDNFIYGIDQAANGTSYIVQIAANGASRSVGVMPTPNAVWNVGDIDTSGRYWVSVDGKRWAQIDMKPGSGTFGQVIQSGTATGAKVLDWSYLPSEGEYLWSILNSNTTTSLVRWDLSLHTWTTVQNYAHIDGTNAFGALYASGNGTLYGSENTSGDLWAIPIPSGTPQKVMGGTPTSQNDGARCVYAADPAAAPSSSGS
ncbi:hypothetical protein ANO11243_017930 [Dothideomycetidae sp. 11243]|nr:hypothetical protein ANO11243_017930 [fungal sp. No.11243]